MRLYLLVALFLVLVGSATAASIDDTLLTVTGRNTTINVTQPWTFENMTVGTNGLYVKNLNQTATQILFTFNLTEQNKRYNGTNLPYVLSSSNTEKVIRSQVGPMNVSARFRVPNGCASLGLIGYANGVTARNYTSSQYSCSSNIVTLNPIELRSGSSNVITLYGASSVCTDNIWGVVVVIVILASFIAMLAAANLLNIETLVMMSVIALLIYVFIPTFHSICL